MSTSNLIRSSARSVLVGAAAAGMLVFVDPALAQSSVGSIYGAAEPGATVIVSSQKTSFTRELSVRDDGTFSFSSLPPGDYSVSLQKDGLEVSTQSARVNAGIGTAVSFTVAMLEEVVVLGTAANPIDLKTAQVSTTYSAQQLAQIPVAKDIIDVALLAPGTVKGDELLGTDGQYGHLASFGGASVAENSYYINGFNVTNLFKNLAYAQLPFYAIESQQVITGGYGSEFGLATGGVVNLTTKRGTNEWHGGSAVTWEPNSLRADSPRTYTPDGEAFRDYSRNRETSAQYDVWTGGPIIQDKLFVFAIGEFSNETSLTYPRSYAAVYNIKDTELEKQFGLVNLGWNINAKNLLELTVMQDTRKYQTDQYSNDYDDAGFVTKGDLAGTDYLEEGGASAFGKYTSYVTDAFTVTAQYGQLKSKRENYQRAANGTLISYNGAIGDFDQPGCPYVTYLASWNDANPGAARASCHVSSIIGSQAAEDTRKAGRLDLEYKLDGHTLKGGIDIDRWSSFDGESYSGGTWYRYSNDGTQNVVRVRHFQTGADAKVNTDAYYLKDDWQVTRNLLVQLGLRNDSFENLNGAGQAYVSQDDIWQPRVGFAWDMKGSAQTKVYGSYGVYSLPVAATVAIRGASASYYTQQNFSYTAIDPVTGVPTLGAPLNSLTYINHEDGTTPDPSSVASRGLDPTIQEEFIVGFQTALGANWRAGVRGTYRNLKKTIDDMCDLRPFETWAAANGYAFDDTNLPGCFIFNPGEAMEVAVDVNGDGVKENVRLTPEMIGSPKAIRKYYAVELSLEKLWSDRWYTQMSYTWAHNYGNAEGLVKSDIGQDDTGVTQDFDFPELMDGAYGDLPNDRRHTLKLLGAYAPLEEVTLSANVLAQSGRPKNCFGVSPVDADFGYGASYFVCNGVVVPRGSAGRTNTVFNLDLGVTYRPRLVPGLSLQAKVFNVLNGHAGLSVSETGEEDNGDGTGEPRSAYGSTSSYQTPRYVQLTASYEF